jgi:hypothetical protein
LILYHKNNREVSIIADMKRFVRYGKSARKIDMLNGINEPNKAVPIGTEQHPPPNKIGIMPSPPVRTFVLNALPKEIRSIAIFRLKSVERITEKITGPYKSVSSRCGVTYQIIPE